MTIVKNYRAVKFYPLSRLAPGVVRAYERLAAADPKAFHPNFGHNTLFGLLECYLDLRSVDLDIAALKTSSSDPLLAGFVGALRSDSFVCGLGRVARGNYVTVFRRLVATIRGRPLSATLLNDETCAAAWTHAKLNQTAIEYWRGWFSGGDEGSLLSLHLVWRQLGPEFCESTHDALVNYWAGRKASISNSISVFNHLFAYIRSHATHVTAFTFSDAVSFKALLESFGNHFFLTAKETGVDIRVCRKRWDDWGHVVENVLCTGSTWAKISIPSAGGRKEGNENWIGTDENGAEVKTKFLVDIPLDLTDEQALEGIQRHIDVCLKSVVDWATAKVDEIVAAHRYGEEIRHTGTNLLVNGRIIGNNRHVSEADVAATFAECSFDMFQGKAHFVGVRNFTTSQVAKLLGIPVSGSLDPFVFLLINEHQEITEAFVKSIELLDLDGNEYGFAKTDEGYFLVGDKKRKGEVKAEQKITLNARSIEIVQKIILLTAPLRIWMRANNQPGWNKLLLNCGKGLSTPTPMRPASKAKTEADIPTVPNFDSSVRGARWLYDRLTFTTFRATKALQQYFVDGDDVALTVRLGHARHSQGLLDHYIPKEVRTFMKARHVRIVQTLIVSMALEDSPFRVEASGFKNQEEFDAFLQVNKLRGLNSSSQSIVTAENASEILLNTQHELLVVLAAIVHAAEKNLPILNNFKEWAAYAKLLFEAAKLQTRNSNLQEKIRAAMVEGCTDRYIKLVCS